MSGLDHKGRLRELGQIPPSYKDESLALAFVALEAQYYAYELEVEAAAHVSIYRSIYACIHTYIHALTHALILSLSLSHQIEAATEGSDVLTVPLFRGEDQDESKTYLAGGMCHGRAGWGRGRPLGSWACVPSEMQLVGCPVHLRD